MPPDEEKTKAVLFDPSRRAASHIRARARIHSEVARDLLPEMRGRAIAVAGIEDMKALGRIQEAIAAVPEGADWRSARKQIAEEIREQWSRDSEAAAATTPEKLAAAAAGKAEAVLRDNAFQAYAASRYEEQQAFAQDFPYLQYITMGDHAVRPSHAALDGKILPIDDPFWRTHYPPWDWGCRCIVESLTEEEARAAGIATAKDMERFKQAHGEPTAEDYHHHPGDLRIPLADILDGKTPEQASLFAATALDNRLTLPDGTEQTVWRWTLDIKPGLAGAKAAAQRHMSDDLTAIKIKDTPEQIEALNTATEAFSAARVTLGQPKTPRFGTTNKEGVLASTLTYVKTGENAGFNYNPDEWAKLDKVFKETVEDRLKAGKIRHFAAPSAAEFGKTLASHEYGHALFNASNAKGKDARLKKIFKKAMKNGDIKTISEYAESKEDGSEFIAEAFAMHRNGETLPDYITTFIKEIMK